MALKIIIILILFSLLSLLVSKNKNHWLITQSTLFGIIFIFLSYISLIISILIITFIFDLFNLDYGEFFLFGIIITFTSGVIQLAIIKLLFFKLEVKSDIITVLEHFIQWLLVYFVIYQSFTQNLTVNNKDLNNLGVSTFIDINNLNLFVLPVLLITWITVFMYKIK